MGQELRCYFFESKLAFSKKHSEKTLGEIVVSDPTYINWLLKPDSFNFCFSDKTLAELVQANPRFSLTMEENKRRISNYAAFENFQLKYMAEQAQLDDLLDQAAAEGQLQSIAEQAQLDDAFDQAAAEDIH